MSNRTVLIVVVALACLALLAPFAAVAVWSGHFSLTIQVTASQPIDTTSLRYVTLWREDEADDLVRERAASGADFRDAIVGSDGALTLSVPCGGRSGPYGLNYSYVQPTDVVVEFRAVGQDAPVSYKKLRIPPGRGPREVTLSLP